MFGPRTVETIKKEIEESTEDLRRELEYEKGLKDLVLGIRQISNGIGKIADFLETGQRHEERFSIRTRELIEKLKQELAAAIELEKQSKNG